MQISIWDHFDELRGRLIKVLLVITGLTALSFIASEWMLICLLKPSPLHHQTLTSLQPAGVFTQTMHLSLICGFVLSLPVILYHAWGFVAPGLRAVERKIFLLSLYAGTILFIIGVLFAYYYVVPKALGFFFNYSKEMGIEPSWTLDNYLNFVLMFLLAFGLAFELPLVLLLLIRFKILTPTQLSSKRPYIIVGISIVAAILTPPDVVSQLLLGIPLWLLFELSLFASRWVV